MASTITLVYPGGWAATIAADETRPSAQPITDGSLPPITLLAV